MEMKTTIQRGQPIADQVLTLLRQRIREGTYGPENRLPSESELASELGVSRATIRSALSTLSAERLIVRRQGDGTYINHRFQDTTIHFGAINEFTSMIVASAHVPTIRALGIDTRACTPEEGAALQVPEGTNVLVLIRLFYSDNRPAIYSINSIPETLVCRQLQKHDLEEPLPIFFKRLCRQEFTYGISNLGAEDVPPEIAHYLDVQDYSPLVCMHEVFYNSQDKPLVTAVNYFNNAVFQLKVARSFQ
jgi:GntR family transcriptional regulator